MENNPSEIGKLTGLKPRLSPNKSPMRTKKKQSSKQSTPTAHETATDQTTTVSPDTSPYASGSNQRENQNEVETPKKSEHPFITEEEKQAIKNLYPVYDYESSDEEQVTKTSISRNDDVNKQEKIIEDMEQTIDQNTTMINRLSKKIKNLEEKAEATYNHPDITSKDREAKMKVRNDQKDILSSLAAMEDAMAKLVNAKNIAYDKIRGMKQELEAIENDMKQHDKFILKNRENIAQLSDDVKVQIKENRYLRRKMEEHDIKLNASGTISRKPWALQSDTAKYPILQTYESTSRYSRLAPMLDTIILKGDNVMEIRQFYNLINTAIMTSLASMKFLPDYDDLTTTFDYESHIVPPSNHTQFEDAQNAYKQYGRTLLLHLQKQTTIPSNSAPATAIKQQENSMATCGFKMLFEIITSMSPQLGGQYRDLQQYVDTLVIADGEPVLEYYLRALKMSQEIQTQKDKTGQNNRLIRKFVTQLFQIKSFTECMRETMTSLSKFFRVPDNHFRDFPHNLQTIYKNDIIDKCAPSMITPNAKYIPIQPQVASVNARLHTNEDTSQNKNSDEEKLHDVIINAARATMSTTDNTSYKPTRCKACGLTQKECHQAMKAIHDPDDPTKCCFRGPKYITDKHMKETVMQYNLKNTGDYPATIQDTDKPPQKAFIPHPKVNAATIKVDEEKRIPQPIVNTTRLDPIQDLISGIEADPKEHLHNPTAHMLYKTSSQTQKNNIDKDRNDNNILSVLEYCETCNEIGEAGTPCEYCSQPYPTCNVQSEPPTPIFNMSDLETMAKTPPITPQQHESYQE